MLYWCARSVGPGQLAAVWQRRRNFRPRPMISSASPPRGSAATSGRRPGWRRPPGWNWLYPPPRPSTGGRFCPERAPHLTRKGLTRAASREEGKRLAELAQRRGHIQYTGSPGRWAHRFSFGSGQGWAAAVEVRGALKGMGQGERRLLPEQVAAEGHGRGGVVGAKADG